jgi:hypothetical protein
LIEQPLQIFWTTYDPLDLASGSLDPLGFARGYLALADRFLPGLTTVTTVPRYVSMLCAALKAVQTYRGAESNFTSSKIRQERLRMVKSYERAWALACGLVNRTSIIGRESVVGLRGVRYINRRLDLLSANDKYIQTGSYNLLSNQVRYGGIGIYSTFLEKCHLASMDSLTLCPLGEELAKVFPGPPIGTMVHDEDARLSLRALDQWGRLAHVGAFTKGEGTVIAEALRGGEEADHDDRVRSASLRMLATAKSKPDDFDEGALLHGLAWDIQDGKFKNLNAPAVCLAQIDAILRVLEPFERFYQGVTFFFEQIRGAASDEGEARLIDVANQESASEAVEAVCKGADELKKNLLTASDVSPTTATEVGTVFKESDILSFADDILRAAKNADELMRIVLRRHSQVQSGRFDKGLPKGAWVRLNSSGDRVQLTAQRHQLAPSERPANWKVVGRHPYRTRSAFAFIHSCKMDIA